MSRQIVVQPRRYDLMSFDGVMVVVEKVLFYSLAIESTDVFFQETFLHQKFDDAIIKDEFSKHLCEVDDVHIPRLRVGAQDSLGYPVGIVYQLKGKRKDQQYDSNIPLLGQRVDSVQIGKHDSPIL